VPGQFLRSRKLLASAPMDRHAVDLDTQIAQKLAELQALDTPVWVERPLHFYDHTTATYKDIPVDSSLSERELRARQILSLDPVGWPNSKEEKERLAAGWPQDRIYRWAKSRGVWILLVAMYPDLFTGAEIAEGAEREDWTQKTASAATFGPNSADTRSMLSPGRISIACIVRDPQRPARRT
jgi:hypothetical protein